MNVINDTGTRPCISHSNIACCLYFLHSYYSRSFYCSLSYFCILFITLHLCFSIKHIHFTIMLLLS